MFVLGAFIDLLESLACSISSSTCVAVFTKSESSMSDQSSSGTFPSMELRLALCVMVAEEGREALEPKE